ncbi:MAG: alpha/beta hydrolase [Deltaproteobacteria bacterium]|nr:alpha/beta hydrolase [Deltaproteobacteria bacterium]
MLPFSTEESAPGLHITRQGIRLAYYSHGQGQTLVLIRGYANAASMWYSQVPFLSRHFRVVTFDNRDTGNSDRVDGPYTIADLAEDTVSLLEFLNAGPVHLLGLSLGGMIAQEVTVRRPDLVQTLLLAGTACDSDRGLTTDPEILKGFATQPELSAEENVRRSLPIFFSSATLAERALIDEYVRRSLEQRPPPTTFERHSRALQGFNRCAEIRQIRCPTLILHGGADRLLPPVNAERLRERIPGAELKFYAGLGHLFLMEDPAAVNQDILTFIQKAAQH